MKIMLKSATFLTLSTAILFTGCGGSDEEQAASQPATTANVKKIVYTTNYPLTYFAETIAGDTVEIVFPVDEDADPAYWSPSPDDVMGFQEADLVLTNGATYEKWLDKVSLKSSTLVDTTESISDRLLEIEEATTHSHGPGGEHSHAGTAIITWLNMQNASAQARAVHDALAELNPEAEEEYNERFNQLSKSLDEVHDALKTASFGKKSEKPLIGSHPVFQYLEDGYNLNIEPVHFESDEMPEGETLSEFESLLEEHPAKYIIWEAEPLEETVTMLENDYGVKSVVFNLIGNTPESGDFISVMMDNAEALNTALSE